LVCLSNCDRRVITRSHSLQDSNCLINFEICAPRTTGSVENCLYYDIDDEDEKCELCKDEYAASNDGKIVMI
jgi:hypothetical protein